PLDAFPALEGSVRRPDVLKQPVAPVLPQNGVPPRDARVVDDDVGLRVPADVVAAAGGKRALRVRRAHEQHGISGGMNGLWRHGSNCRAYFAGLDTAMGGTFRRFGIACRKGFAAGHHAFRRNGRRSRPAGISETSLLSHPAISPVRVEPEEPVLPYKRME